MALTQISSNGVKDDSIVNADIKSDAAIALSKLASTPAVLTGSTDNTICTVTGANAIQGEANLTFDGTKILNISSSAGGFFQGTDTDGGVALIEMGNGNVAIQADTGNAVADSKVHFYVDNSEKMVLDSSGRLLLGTTVEGRATWGENFTIADAASCGMTIRSGTGSYGSLYFSDAESGAGEYTGLVEYYHQTNQLAFYTATSQRLVLDNSGNVTINDGDLKIGTAGHGIDFSATSDASGMTSELLDHYEEGTFTPTITAEDGGSWAASTYNKIAYTRIGRQVHIQGYLSIDSQSSPSGDVRISLPFTVVNNLSSHADYPATVCQLRGHTGATDLYNVTGAPQPGQTFMQLNATAGNGSNVWLDHTHCGSSWNIRLGGSYICS